MRTSEEINQICKKALQEYLNRCSENELIALKYLDRLSIKEV